MVTNNSQSSQLCLTCGICCQGIFFYHHQDPKIYGLDPEHGDRVNKNPLLPLCCQLYRGNRCIIYNHPKRPSICGEYQCQILKELLTNKINLEQSKQIIEMIKNLINKIVLQLPQPIKKQKPAIHLMSDALKFLQKELSVEDRATSELLKDLISLKCLLHRYIYIIH